MQEPIFFYSFSHLFFFHAFYSISRSRAYFFFLLSFFLSPLDFYCYSGCPSGHRLLFDFDQPFRDGVRRVESSSLSLSLPSSLSFSTRRRVINAYKEERRRRGNLWNRIDGFEETSCSILSVGTVIWRGAEIDAIW